MVDMDLKAFFDEVNHDILTGLIRRRISDAAVLKVIRGYLNAGILTGGVVHVPEKGTPQGGPLSPLLSNILLNELDRELERRGHCFCRCADDCTIYVRTRRSGERVLHSIATFIEQRLKLKVNWEKSAVARPGSHNFPGFTFIGPRGSSAPVNRPATASNSGSANCVAGGGVGTWSGSFAGISTHTCEAGSTTTGPRSK